ncbi:hypothetical protein FRB93_011089 [Tulasnella sp. JGI-2019a]|nr:hypothetical protein FRB93_011089 [Tulasnella sp. JGI-2019a]
MNVNIAALPPDTNTEKLQTTPFGTKSEFWEKYDVFAVKVDKDMTGSLNTNLDVLLIFAGLFSAVNTAFIVVTLTALSANPADETNHLLRLLLMNSNNLTLTENDLSPPFVPGRAAIRQNCIFFASLSCSLLAAIGAVLAKQWLQSYERTGQTGTLEQQAIERTRKFFGAQDWGLRPVVETLATLLIVSLTLFFTALIDYLRAVNQTVAVVVLVFAVIGGMLYFLMVVLAAIFSECPFQTGPSSALRELCLVIQRSIYSPNINPRWLRDIPFNYRVDHFRGWIKDILHSRPSHPFNTRDTLLLYFRTFASLLLCVPAYILFTIIIPFLRSRIPRNDKQDVVHSDSLCARSAILIAETASNSDNVIAAADNIPLISDFDATRLIVTSTAFETLLTVFQKSYRDDCYSGNEGDSRDTLKLARAVAYVMLSDPKRTASLAQKYLSRLGRAGRISWSMEPIHEETFLFLRCIMTMCELSVTRYYISGDQICRLGNLPLDIPRRSEIKFPPRRSEAREFQDNQSNFIFWLHYCNVIAAYNRWDDWVMEDLVRDMGDIILVEDLKPDAAYLSRVIDSLVAILKWYPRWGRRHGRPSLDDTAKLRSAWIVSESRALNTQLSNALDEFSRHYATEDPDTFATFLTCQKRLLAHVNTSYESYHDSILSLPLRPQLNGSLHSSLNTNLERLLAIDPILSSPNGDVTVKPYEEEVIRALQRLLQTWTVTPIDLAATARLALRVTGRDQLLNGLLYNIFLQERPKIVLDFLDRHDPLEGGQLIGTLLTSTLQLHTWLHPSTDAYQMLAALEPLLRVLGCTGSDYARAIVHEVWEDVMRIVREDDPPQYGCTIPCVIRYALNTHRIYDVSQEMDERRLREWFTKFMREVQQDKASKRSYRPWIGGNFAGSSLSQERKKHWTPVDAKCAGILFLDAWDAVMNADDEGSPTSHSPHWTSSETLEAFATWLSDYDGAGVVTRLDDMSPIRIPWIPVDHGLVTRFVEHATLLNGEIAQGLRLYSLLEEVSLVDETPRGGVYNSKQDLWVPQPVIDANDLYD